MRTITVHLTDAEYRVAKKIRNETRLDELEQVVVLGLERLAAWYGIPVEETEFRVSRGARDRVAMLRSAR